MTHQAPDELHAFTGWSVERFGNRCFVVWSDASAFHASLPRYEISQADFEAAKSRTISLTRLKQKYDTEQSKLLEGIANPKPGMKIFLISSFLFIAGALVAILMGWA